MFKPWCCLYINLIRNSWLLHWGPLVANTWDKLRSRWAVTPCRSESRAGPSWPGETSHNQQKLPHFSVTPQKAKDSALFFQPRNQQVATKRAACCCRATLKCATAPVSAVSQVKPLEWTNGEPPNNQRYVYKQNPEPGCPLLKTTEKGLKGSSQFSPNHFKPRNFQTGLCINYLYVYIYTYISYIYIYTYIRTSYIYIYVCMS